MELLPRINNRTALDTCVGQCARMGLETVFSTQRTPTTTSVKFFERVAKFFTKYENQLAKTVAKDEAELVEVLAALAEVKLVYEATVEDEIKPIQKTLLRLRTALEAYQLVFQKNDKRKLSKKLDRVVFIITVLQETA